MKDHIEMCINGNTYQVGGEDVFLPLSDYLRTKVHLPGTKEVCIEGDCGACTVLLGKAKNEEVFYQTIDSCICYVYQLNKCHVVTVEGLKNSKLNPVQEAMVINHGAQCGYCTPGFIVSLYSFFNTCPKSITKPDIQNTLVGNLCRCTGYETIIEAGLSVDSNSVKKIDEIYPSKKLSILELSRKESIEVNTGEHVFYEPLTLKEALKLKDENLDSKLLLGGTDMHVMCNKRDFNPNKIIYLSNLNELKNIEIKNNHLIMGAAVTLSEFEIYASQYYPGLKEFLELFASPQIKNIGTVVGNIANGSPIGDTLPFLFVMEADVTLESVKGKRTININTLYKGYRSLAMDLNEIITHVNIPLLSKDEILRLYKVSKRKHLDISSFSAAIKLRQKEGIIQSISIAFGGVGPTIQRITEVEKYLCGKRIGEDVFEEAVNLMDNIIQPISDVRGEKGYRLRLAKNIIKKFYFEIKEENKVFA